MASINHTKLIYRLRRDFHIEPLSLFGLPTDVILKDNADGSQTPLGVIIDTATAAHFKTPETDSHEVWEDASQATFENPLFEYVLQHKNFRVIQVWHQRVLVYAAIYTYLSPHTGLVMILTLLIADEWLRIKICEENG